MDARDIAPDLADGTLLRRFVEAGDDKAFTRLVERHGGLVLGVACRALQNRSEAEEAAQRVFIVFARKAPDLLDGPSVAGWLHRAATLESLKLRREHRRRTERIEAMKAKQIPGPDDTPENDWSGRLDEAMDKLRLHERELLVMHFLEGRSFVEIARDLKLSAEAVRKRNERALARLALLLGRRGAAGTASLALLLASQKVDAIPPALAKAWAAHSLAAFAEPAVATSAFTKTLLAMKTGKTGFIAVVLLAAAFPIGLQAARSAFLAPHTASGAFTGITSSPAPAPARSNKTAKVPLTAEQLSAAFHRVESGEEPLPGAQLVLHRLIFTLDPAELKIARELLGSVQKHDRFREIALAIYARWAELDPREATTTALAAGQMTPLGSNPLNGAFGTWADADPDAALEWLAEAAKLPQEGPMSLQYLARQWTHRLLSEGNPEAALRIAGGIGAAIPAWSDDLNRYLLKSWVELDPAASQAWLEGSIKDRSPAERDAAWFDWSKAARESHPQAALDAAQHIESMPQRKAAILNVILNWGRDSPDAFRDYLSRPGILEAWDADLLNTTGEMLARNHAGDAIRMVERFAPGSRRDQFMDGLLRASSYVEPSQLAPIAADLNDDYLAQARTRGFTCFITEWAKRDPAATEHWVNALPEGNRKAEASAALSNAKDTQEGGQP